MRLPVFLKKIDFWLALGLFGVLVQGLFLDLMDVDATQYASISMEMLQGGQWLQVMHRGTDYLDKPPLLFWTSAASMAMFGCSNFAYKLPSFLAALASVYAVFRFAQIFYDRQTATDAAFIFASSLGFFLLTNDVRTDTLLLAATTCAIWQLADYLRFRRWQNWLAAFACIGLAMLAKGPIGLVVPAFAVGTQLVLRREWRQFFRWEWLAGLLVVGVVLAPMCWGLYHQFDLHPEKPTAFRNTTSGLYFFFWEQSFGRVTGENVWQDDSTPLYFVHTYLWAFLPCTLLFAGALFERLRSVFLKKISIAADEEAYSLGAFVLTFVALSTSNYKLPHYIFVTLPWASVLTARFLNRTAGFSFFKKTTAVVALLIAGILAFSIPSFIFFEREAWILIVLSAVFAAAVFLKISIVHRLVLVSICFGIALNFWFYPHLLPYQSTAQAGRFFKKNGIPAREVGFFGRHGHALDFYSGGITQQLASADSMIQFAENQRVQWIYTTPEGRDSLALAGVRYAEVARLDHFQAARLNATFLNPQTRRAALDTVFILKILHGREDQGDLPSY